MADYLRASLAGILPGETGTPSHACCPSKQDPAAPHAHHGDAESTGCCIQDANAKLPQFVSEGTIQPPLTALMIEWLRPLDASRLHAIYAQVPKLSISDPPLYLAHLQLLI